MLDIQNLKVIYNRAYSGIAYISVPKDYVNNLIEILKDRVD